MLYAYAARLFIYFFPWTILFLLFSAILWMYWYRYSKANLGTLEQEYLPSLVSTFEGKHRQLHLPRNSPVSSVENSCFLSATLWPSPSANSTAQPVEFCFHSFMVPCPIPSTFHLGIGLSDLQLPFMTFLTLLYLTWAANTHIFDAIIWLYLLHMLAYTW